MTELVLECSDGSKIAGQLYKNNVTSETTERILCLHGWMDNCRSFYHLAPAVAEGVPHNVELFAMDFPGHGLSSHRPVSAPPTMLSEFAYAVAEAVHQLDWIPPRPQQTTEEESTSSPFFTIVGHSMGAAVGCTYAAAFPEQVQRLVLVEGAGPLFRNASDVSKHIRQHVQKRLEGNKNPKQPRVYPSLEKAVQTRCMTAQYSPGNQWLSVAAAREIVLRATEAVPNEPEGSVRFRHDPRLQWPSLQYFTAEQVNALYDNIQCPTALILAKDGWPFSEDRMQASLELLQPVLYTTLPGSHHFHADPESAEAVVQEVVSFLKL